MKTNTIRRGNSSHAFGFLAACLMAVGSSSSFAQEIDAQGFTRPPAPDVSCAYPSQDCLWSPNHKFVPITVEGVKIANGDCVGTAIYCVTSDEPNACIEGAGGNNHAPDAAIGCEGKSVDLRAERSGAGNGRVYQIKFVAWNQKLAKINPFLALFTVRLGAVEVKVPHDQSDKDCCPAVDDGQCYVIAKLSNAWTHDGDD